MDFTWNQALYEDIVNRAESLEKKRDMKHILDIGSEKYEALVTVAEEEFLTHPDGPYPGTRDEMKHDENYLRKKLIQIERSPTPDMRFRQRSMMRPLWAAESSGSRKGRIIQGLWS